MWRQSHRKEYHNDHPVRWDPHLNQPNHYSSPKEVSVVAPIVGAISDQQPDEHSLEHHNRFAIPTRVRVLTQYRRRKLGNILHQPQVRANSNVNTIIIIVQVDNRVITQGNHSNHQSTQKLRNSPNKKNTKRSKSYLGVNTVLRVSIHRLRHKLSRFPG